MLRITRKTGERIMLGDDVVDKGMANVGDRLAIPVYREEIWLEVKRENEAAALAASAPLPSVRLKGAGE